MYFSAQREELSSSAYVDMKHQVILELDVPLLYFIDLLQIAAKPQIIIVLPFLHSSQ